MAKKGIKWQQVNTDTFPADLRATFKKFEAAVKNLDELKEEFFTKAREHVKKSGKGQEGKIPSFNYTGTALLIAFVDQKAVNDRDLFSF
jgi:hypothetical protein